MKIYSSLISPFLAASLVVGAAISYAPPAEAQQRAFTRNLVLCLKPRIKAGDKRRDVVGLKVPDSFLKNNSIENYKCPKSYLRIDKSNVDILGLSDDLLKALNTVLDNQSKIQNGLAGAAGVAGAQGAKGDKGDTGAAGPAGAAGAKGDTGAAGAKGDRGENGVAGATGAQGAKGDTGAAGAQGATGAQGVKGDTGAQGAAGATGAQGVKGDTGAQGPAGATGAQGVKGDTGAQGAAGATGAQGPQGATGPQGARGATGAQGPQGATGPQGPAGQGGINLTSCERVQDDQAQYPYHLASEGPNATEVMCPFISGSSGDRKVLHWYSYSTTSQNGSVFAAITDIVPLTRSAGTSNAYAHGISIQARPIQYSGPNAEFRVAVNAYCCLPRN